MSKTVYISDAPEYFRLFSDGTKEVHGVRMVNEEMILVNYLDGEEFVRGLLSTNVAIARYVLLNFLI